MKFWQPSADLTNAPQRAKLYIQSRYKVTTTASVTLAKKTKIFLQCRFKAAAMPFRVLFLWLLIECLLCFLVLCTRTDNYVVNFLKYVCAKSRCATFLESALQGRIMLSILAMVGILINVTLLIAPWFFMNAFGFFPLLPVMYSCYGTYEELGEKLEAGKFIVKVSSDIFNFLVPEE
ncbi:hypothetical protein Bhyg_10768 [Pseudolycoriella hygida]|uniref:Uncharacterized protein n=1 Tax=Pseudolycoriella hygida TaxID=35572 RepID=A0A9Q0MU48_9DIPT|nr:hypothetical protein Bhyg_10768 [Pseudolycoriella hygida]